MPTGSSWTWTVSQTGVEGIQDKETNESAGNTFSGRFYRLLQSRSMVIKQTIFTEWHDDRLLPWVHYAPVSTSFDELPEIARFFATTERGQALAKRMAEESTVWHNKALRDVDIRLVWLRMLLAYGRLMSPGLEVNA